VLVDDLATRVEATVLLASDRADFRAAVKLGAAAVVTDSLPCDGDRLVHAYVRPPAQFDPVRLVMSAALFV
jgi:hypothetical protein